MPSRSVFPVSDVPLVVLSVVLGLSTPALFAQLWILSTASLMDDLISEDCSERPPTTRRKISTASAMKPRSTIAAPANRGMRRCCILVTRGPATVARIAPTATGRVIVEVMARSHVSPTTRSATPTRNHASNPRSRTHTGAENTRDSPDASMRTTVGSEGASGSVAVREASRRNRSNRPIRVQFATRATTHASAETRFHPDERPGPRRRAEILETSTRRRETVALKHPKRSARRPGAIDVAPLFGLEARRIPRHSLPESELPADVAYQIIHDELMLDGNARLNVATFVSTWMEPQAEKLMAECFDKNMIDKDEYPQTAEIESRCVNILANLWNAPAAEQATGCSTTGSSEAAMLGGLALKRRWQERRAADGKPTDKPNLVMGINVQVCWEKFANYWDVEMRLVPMEGDRFTLSAEEAVTRCDENTIGVTAILGSTFDGAYEPVQEICDALDAFQRDTGIDVPVHVDGASGAMIAPFLDPDLEWDFRLPRVVSINTSGHKYGLVYPGVGWVVWRDADSLPDELIFWVNYLGDNMPTFALNFSRPGAQVVAQYYNFLRLGFEGYRRVQGYARDVATRLAGRVAELGPFELLTQGDELPVFAFRLTEDVDNFTVFDVSNALRERGWQVPAYTFPEHRTDLAALRIVVRRGFTHDLADLLVADIERQLPRLQNQPAPVHDAAAATAFAH